MSKKKKKPKTKKIDLPKEKQRDYAGGTTRCRFCRRWVKLSEAWYHPNCGGYQERFKTSGDVLANNMIVEPLEDVDIQEAVEEDSNGES